jgi:tetratricopeptide (TPR) repeat protein
VDGLGPDRKVRIVDTGVSPFSDGRRKASPVYGAPELDSEERFDGRADLYSLAVVVYELLVGRLPFAEQRREALLQTKAKRDLPPLRLQRKDCPGPLEDLLMRMGSREPRFRPRNALALARELPRTGLLKGARPTLDPAFLVENTRWRTTEVRVREVLKEFPEGPLPTEVKCQESLENVADEIRARATLRRPLKIFRLLPSSRREKGTPTKSIAELPSRTLALRPVRNRGDFADDAVSVVSAKKHAVTVDLPDKPSPDDIRRWLFQFCIGPIDRRRVKLLSPWLHWRFDGLEQQISDYLKKALTFDEGLPSLKWDEIGAEIVRSLPKEDLHRAPHRATWFPKATVMENAKLLKLHCWPVEAAQALEASCAVSDSQQNLTQCRKARLHLVVGIYYQLAGAMNAASRAYQEAERALQSVDGALAKLLLLRAREAEARTVPDQRAISNTLRTGMDVETVDDPRLSFAVAKADVRYNHDRNNILEAKKSLLRAERILKQLCAMNRERVQFKSDRECGGTRAEPDWASNCIRTRALRFQQGRQLYCEKAYEGAIAEGKRIAEEESGIAQYQAQALVASALIKLGRCREAMAFAVRAGKGLAQRGCLHLARGALGSIAISFYRLGEPTKAEAWLFASSDEGRGTAYARLATLTRLSAVAYAKGDYSSASVHALRGIRLTRLLGSRHRLRVLFQHSFALALARLGRLDKAMQWLERCVKAAEDLGEADVLEYAGLALLNISSVCGNIGNYQAAVDRIGTWGASSQVQGVIFASQNPRWFRRVRDRLHVVLDRPENARIDRLLNSTADSWGDVMMHLRALQQKNQLDQAELEGIGYCRRILWTSIYADPDLFDSGEGRIQQLLSDRHLPLASRAATLGAARFASMGWVVRASNLLDLGERAQAILDSQIRSKTIAQKTARFCLRQQFDSVEGSVKQQLELASRLEQACNPKSCEKIKVGPIPFGDRGSEEVVDSLLELCREDQAVGSVWIFERRTLSELGAIHFRRDWRRAHRCTVSSESLAGVRNVLPAGILLWLDERGHLRVFVASKDERVGVLAELERGDDRSSMRLWSLCRACRTAVASIARHLAKGKCIGDEQRAPTLSCDRPVRQGDRPAWNLKKTHCGRDLLYVSKEMAAAVRRVETLAKADVPILLRGESGTGKEVLARWAHSCSKRRRRRFVVVDCPSICTGIAESELFGHRRGSFSGAEASRDGLMVIANHGTLFLDEIGDLDYRMQAKLLRVLSTGEVRAIGASRTVLVEFGLVSATNADLREGIGDGSFRLDLLHRLGVEVLVPPLRERKEDIIPLWEHFLSVFATDEVIQYSEDVLDYLLGCKWSGNARELRNTAQAAVALRTGPIISVDVLEEIGATGIGEEKADVVDAGKSGRLMEVHGLVLARGRITRRECATRLGISPRSALRDLSELVARGLLVRVGRGRATRYVRPDFS